MVASAKKGYQAGLEGLARTKAQLEAERAELASAQLFATEADGGRTLVTVNPDLFAPRGSRDTIRVITVFWKWDEKDPPKADVIRRFKESFDFAALRDMIEK